MSALHRFFCDRPTVAAHCGRCGRLVATYWAHDPGCPVCTVADDKGWQEVSRCRCDPRPVLPEGSALAEDIAKGHATRRMVWHRARQRTYI